MMSHTVLIEIKSIPAHTGIMLHLELMAAKYITVVMGMKLHIELGGNFTHKPTLEKAQNVRYADSKEMPMPQAPTMSLHDQPAIGIQVIELKKQGKLEEARALQHTMPLPAYIAKWTKKRFGAEILLKTVWNLSEAEAEYGPDWLSK